MPSGVVVIHHRDFHRGQFNDHTDEPYFRLYHDLQGLRPPVLPAGFQLCAPSPEDYAAHIGRCYTDLSLSEDEVRAYLRHSVYAPDLWVAVQERDSGRLAATGIGELDTALGEGILEWIQVSPEYRGLGLGRYLVTELLWRIAPKAQFATVSGRVDDPCRPERLYRACGFTGTDIWHVLRRRGPCASSDPHGRVPTAGAGPLGAERAGRSPCESDDR